MTIQPVHSRRPSSRAVDAAQKWRAQFVELALAPPPVKRSSIIVCIIALLTLMDVPKAALAFVGPLEMDLNPRWPCRAPGEVLSEFVSHSSNTYT